MAGAPKGNKNATKNKHWTVAIENALSKRGGGEKMKALNALAEQLLIKCDEGDMVALKELGDRIEGKVSQPMDHTGSVTVVASTYDEDL